MENLNLTICGMHCATCARKIEKVLASTKGILSVTVNFSTENTIITYDEKVIDEKKIIKIIEKLDYKPKKETTENENIKIRKRNFNIWIKKLIIGLSLTALLVFTGRFLLPNLKWLLGYMHNPLLFLLTAIIFYVVGFPIIKMSIANLSGIKNSRYFLLTLVLILLLTYILLLTVLPFLSPHISRIFLYENFAGIVILTALCHVINIRAKEKLNKDLETLSNLQPKKARVIRHDMETEVDISNIKIGDNIKVKQGEAIPTDGIIIKGATLVNESIIAGGEIQSQKNIGDEVISGTINNKETIIIKVTQGLNSNTLSQIKEILEKTKKFESVGQKRIGIFVSAFKVIILIFAVLTAIFWILYYDSFFLGIVTFSTILLVSNPYIFISGLEDSFTYGIRKLAKQGILFKGNKVIEMTGKIQRLVFDKTGILTMGIPEITNVVSKEAFNEKRFLILTGSLENTSTHRFAEAIIKYCRSKDISFKNAYDCKYREGEGIIGIVDSQEIIAGNMKLMKKSNVQMNEELVHKAEILSKNVRSPVYVARNRELIGLIGIADTIKDNAKEAISILKKNKYKLTMVTGDNEKITQHIAEELRIKNFLADMLQKEKIEAVQNFQENKEKVAFVGDGLQDAPVLAQADVGIALGTGTDTNLGASDITIISNNLMNIPKALLSAEKINEVIKKNTYIATLYHIIVLPLAAGVPYFIAGIFMHPLLAPFLSGAIYIAILKNTFRLKTTMH